MSTPNQPQNDAHPSVSPSEQRVGPETGGLAPEAPTVESAQTPASVPADDAGIRALLAQQSAMIEELRHAQVELQHQLESNPRSEARERRQEEKLAQKEARAELRRARRAARQADKEAKRSARELAHLEREEARANLELQNMLERETRPHDAEDNHAADEQGAAFRRAFYAALRQAGALAGVLGGHSLRLARHGSAAAGRASTAAVEFVDIDVRAQFKEAPLLGLMQLLPYDPVPYRQPASEHPPLVMIHGLAGSSGNFAAMRLWLSMHRPRPVHVFDYRGYGDIFAASKAFEVWLDEVFALYPESQDIEILAHSMGGLLARYALLSPARAARMSHMVTLGTPHHGTNLARWGGATYVRQLRMNSEVFQYLEAHESSPLPYRITSVWSERDVMVLPARQAIFEEARSHELSESTHLGWLLHPRLMEKVFHIMDAPRRHVLEPVSVAS